MDDQDKDKKVISLSEVKLERSVNAMVELSASSSNNLYQRGEAYQRVLASQSFKEGGFDDALAWIEKLDLNSNPAEYEWAAAVTRHYSIEQMAPYGMTRMMYLMQYLQLRGRAVPIGDHGLIVIEGPGLDGVHIEKRFADISADEIQSVTRALLKSQAKEEGHDIEDIPSSSEFDFPGDLPDWLGLPQDYEAELPPAQAKEVADFRARLGDKEDRWLQLYKRGGRMYFNIQLNDQEADRVLAALQALAQQQPQPPPPPKKPELELVPKQAEEPVGEGSTKAP